MDRPWLPREQLRFQSGCGGSVPHRPIDAGARRQDASRRRRSDPRRPTSTTVNGYGPTGTLFEGQTKFYYLLVDKCTVRYILPLQYAPTGPTLLAKAEIGTRVEGDCPRSEGEGYDEEKDL